MLSLTALCDETSASVTLSQLAQDVLCFYKISVIIHSSTKRINLMGYNVVILESTFKIPSKNLKLAYDRMCQLNFTVSNKSKGGGRFSSEGGKDTAPEYGPHNSSWFSWMNWNYHETCSTAEEIFSDLGFETNTNENGDLMILYYDSKTGQESLFLESICDLATGYIIWQGEDCEVWGETYGAMKVVTKHQKGYKHLVSP